VVKDQFYFNLYESVFSALPFGILVLDRNQGIVCANKRFYSLFNTREEEPKGKRIQDFLPSWELENHIRCVQADGGVREVELHLKEPSGETKALKITVIGITVVKGIINESSVLLVLEDISERIKLEEQLVQSEKLAAMGELAASITHELGNPLSVMSSTLQYIQGRLKGKEDDISNEIDVIVDSLKRMDELLRGLSDFKTPEQLRFEQEDIHKALSQVLTLVSREARNANVEIKTELAPNPLRCWHDPRQMKQVFLNLFKNAIEAMPYGGYLEIRTWFSPAGGSESRSTIIIEISDAGVGISEEELSLIFKPFYSTKKGGSGLGLPFCRRVIMAHNGTITVKSLKGKGTTFTISIPSDRRREDKR